MSTVLWANQLDGETVTSDEADKWALHSHVKKLDQLTKDAGLRSFSDFLDFTDMQFNVTDAELPAGMESTDELMARDGVWQSADEAVAVLGELLNIVTTKKPRFGLLKNGYDDVVAELTESLEYARKAVAAGAKFNFSVVM